MGVLVGLAPAELPLAGRMRVAPALVAHLLGARVPVGRALLLRALVAQMLAAQAPGGQAVVVRVLTARVPMGQALEVQALAAQVPALVLKSPMRSCSHPRGKMLEGRPTCPTADPAPWLKARG